MTLKFKLKRFSKKCDLHYGIVAVIEKDGKYLLIDRANKPYGHSFITGHINNGERPLEALSREIGEEVGLRVVDHRRYAKKEVERDCMRGANRHFCYFYKCKIGGEIKIDSREVKSAGWYSKEAIRKLKLEPLTKEWFRERGVL